MGRRSTWSARTRHQDEPAGDCNMANEIGKLGIFRPWMWLSPELAAEVEKLGYGTIWLGGGAPDGKLDNVEKLLDATDRIVVATGIVDMWKYDAATIAASYHRLSAKHPGRFLLGLGVGHPEVTQEYMKPTDKIAEYLGQLDRADVPVEDRALAALGPKVLKLAAEHTAGAIPYLTTVAHTHDARQVLGGVPFLAPEHKVILDTDADRARSLARETLQFYLTLSNFISSFRRLGFTDEDFANGGSNRLIDSMVAWGDAESITAGLAEYLDAGADHVAVQALGEDPLPALRAVAELLLA
ncbi:LLM class F420-dependent oxidoreductase [Streptomyces sp. NPDC090088]|uniref:LLM class F420-dependent oxidoreductase n=1 Tax=Streptomyces sp. NPDC090088 TaxID=3365944 RepID=UPI00381D51DA